MGAAPSGVCNDTAGQLVRMDTGIASHAGRMQRSILGMVLSVWATMGMNRIAIPTRHHMLVLPLTRDLP